MLEQITSEEFLKPAAAIGALIMFLILLRKINKLLLFVGVIVLGVLYLLHDMPPWLEEIWASFQI